MPKRYVSREILIGNLTLGGDRAIRVQSMVNTPTLNTMATVDQVVRLAKAGCELVRITAANIREAENLKNILQELKNKNIDIPLIADIHFQPKAAEVAARIVDKVRINPGNYTNPHHRNKKYSETDYRAELEQISRNLKPLLNKEIYRNFSDEIDHRKKENLKSELTFVGVKSAEIKNFEKKDNNYTFTVNFVSEIITFKKDKNNKVIEGSPDIIKTVNDVWKFSKNMWSSNPNWYLVETQV